MINSDPLRTQRGAGGAVVRELTAAGFRIVTRDDAFLDDPDAEQVHWLIVAAA